ncbi:MAG: 50S ribosomal protein L23 [Spirochaetes bacterium]|nr:50S ribosomal protein L23 [Spirochaetota bacterium]
MKSEEIILRPVVTEKSTTIREKENKYVFIVSVKANKLMVKQAIKDLFQVTPTQINIINVKGKKKRVRYKYGYTAAYKKAIVTLAKEDKITIFEGA